jgi:sugar/nucleoside kinase (ribokinase family)
VPRSHPFTAHVPSLSNREGIRYDVVGIGNAIVDVIAMVQDGFLAEHGMTKGSMALIETDRALQLTDSLTDRIETSGGSAANTIAGIASLGGEVAYIGKVSDDAFGRIFTSGMAGIGVDFHSGSGVSDVPTARSIVLVTPDAQRTMNTYLGVSTFLSLDDVDQGLVESAAIVYLEGYLFDRDEAKAAFRDAAARAHARGRVVALTLSDSFCVDRHRADFRALVRDEIDLLFANEDELKSLYECDDFDDAVALLRRDCHIAAVTRSEKGSVIVTRDDIHAVPAVPGVNVVDTTGAGDLFAAGFLRGLTQGKDLTSCARIGAIAAAEVISHVGPRPLVPLLDLLPHDLR